MTDTDKITLGFMVPPATAIMLIAVTKALCIHAGEADGFLFFGSDNLTNVDGFH